MLLVFYASLLSLNHVISLELIRAKDGDIHIKGSNCPDGTIIVQEDETHSVKCIQSMIDEGCDLKFVNDHPNKVAFIPLNRTIINDVKFETTQPNFCANGERIGTKISLQDYPSNINDDVWVQRDILQWMNITFTSSNQIAISFYSHWPGNLFRIYVSCYNDVSGIETIGDRCAFVKFEGQMEYPLPVADPPPTVSLIPTRSTTTTTTTVQTATTSNVTTSTTTTTNQGETTPNFNTSSELTSTTANIVTSSQTSSSTTAATLTTTKPTANTGAITDSDDDNVPLIAGLIAAVVLILIIILLVLCYYYCCKKEKKDDEERITKTEVVKETNVIYRNASFNQAYSNDGYDNDGPSNNHLYDDPKPKPEFEKRFITICNVDLTNKDDDNKDRENPYNTVVPNLSTPKRTNEAPNSSDLPNHSTPKPINETPSRLDLPPIRPRRARAESDDMPNYDIPSRNSSISSPLTPAVDPPNYAQISKRRGELMI